MTNVLGKEILRLNYWEHVKKEKDLAFTYPPDDKRRIAMRKTINEMVDLMNSEPNVQECDAREVE